MSDQPLLDIDLRVHSDSYPVEVVAVASRDLSKVAVCSMTGSEVGVSVPYASRVDKEQTRVILFISPNEVTV